MQEQKTTGQFGGVGGKDTFGYGVTDDGREVFFVRHKMPGDKWPREGAALRFKILPKVQGRRSPEAVDIEVLG